METQGHGSVRARLWASQVRPRGVSRCHGSRSQGCHSVVARQATCRVGTRFASVSRLMYWQRIHVLEALQIAELHRQWSDHPCRRRTPASSVVTTPTAVRRTRRQPRALHSLHEFSSIWWMRPSKRWTRACLFGAGRDALGQHFGLPPQDVLDRSRAPLISLRYAGFDTVRSHAETALSSDQRDGAGTGPNRLRASLPGVRSGSDHESCRDALIGRRLHLKSTSGFTPSCAWPGGVRRGGVRHPTSQVSRSRQAPRPRTDAVAAHLPQRGEQLLTIGHDAISHLFVRPPSLSGTSAVRPPGPKSYAGTRKSERGIGVLDVAVEMECPFGSG